MSAAKRLAATTVKMKPEDIVAPVLKAIQNVRLYVGTDKGVTPQHLDVIERAVMNAMLQIESYGDKHRDAGRSEAWLEVYGNTGETP